MINIFSPLWGDRRRFNHSAFTGHLPCECQRLNPDFYNGPFFFFPFVLFVDLQTCHSLNRWPDGWIVLYHIFMRYMRTCSSGETAWRRRSESERPLRKLRGWLAEPSAGTLGYLQLAVLVFGERGFHPVPTGGSPAPSSLPFFLQISSLVRSFLDRLKRFQEGFEWAFRAKKNNNNKLCTNNHQFI